MAFDLDDEELEATKKLFKESKPTDEEILKNIIAEYDARREESSSSNVVVTIGREGIGAIEYLLKKVQENEKYLVKLTDKQYRDLLDIIKLDVNREWKLKIQKELDAIRSRKDIDGACETALAGFQREAKIDVLRDLLK